jgi:hypothetical protein
LGATKRTQAWLAEKMLVFMSVLNFRESSKEKGEREKAGKREKKRSEGALTPPNHKHSQTNLSKL